MYKGMCGTKWFIPKYARFVVCFFFKLKKVKKALTTESRRGNDNSTHGMATR